MANRPKPCFAERLWCSGLSSNAPRAIEADADQIDLWPPRPGFVSRPGLSHTLRPSSPDAVRQVPPSDERIERLIGGSVRVHQVPADVRHALRGILEFHLVA